MKGTRMTRRFCNLRRLPLQQVTTFCFLAYIASSVFCIGENTTTITNLPPSNLGWEVSQDVRLPARSTDSRIFKVEFTFTATASNNVQIAFGKDANNDWKLPAEETSATVGWDRGAWFLQSGDLRTAFTNTPTNSMETASRTLRMSVRLNANGNPIALSFNDQTGGALAFQNLMGVPSWINPKEWDMAALTSRGWGERDETAKISFNLDGTHILLR
jgi:hypothetical protein